MVLRSARQTILVVVALLAVLAGVCAPARAGAGGAARAGKPMAEGGGKGPVVVVGFSGVSWTDVTRKAAPHLYEFGKKAAVSNIVVRTVHETACPVEGWTALGAGQRTIDDGCRLPAVAGKAPARWARLKEANSSSSYKAKIGALGEALKGRSALAVGPGAALALAKPDGRLVGGYAALAPLPVSGEDGDVGGAARAYARSDADVTMIDLGAVRYPGNELSENHPVEAPGIAQRLREYFTPEGAAPEAVRQQISYIDARFGLLVKQIRKKTPNATVLVANVADAESSRPHLGYFAAAGPRMGGPALATSDSTRQPGLVQVTDIMPTLVGWLGAGPQARGNAIGSAITTAKASDGEANIARLDAEHTRAQVTRSLSGSFYVLLAALSAAILLMWARRNSYRWTETNERFFLQLSALTAALPVSTLLVNLIPWWRMSNPLVSLLMGVVLIAAVLALIALHGKSPFAPFAVIGGVTVATLALDVLLDGIWHGYPLQLAALLGMQPLVGWRFYGFSNNAVAMFVAGLVLVLAWHSSRTARKKSVAVILGAGALAVLLDGSAQFGADFGGPPVIVVGLGVLATMVAGKRLTWLRFGAVLASAVAVSFVFALFDYLQPASRRSHLGKFVGSFFDGGGLGIIWRKFTQIFGGNAIFIPVALAVAAAICAVAWLLAKRGRFARFRIEDEIVRRSVVSLVSALVVAALLNDSGVTMPAVGLIVAAPLWFVATLRRGEGATAGQGDAAVQEDAAAAQEEESVTQESAAQEAGRTATPR